jgi:hypothetical protein
MLSIRGPGEFFSTYKITNESIPNNLKKSLFITVQVLLFENTFVTMIVLKYPNCKGT